jgi:hypothetical protein
MPNPLIDQGTLNRLIASVVIPAFPELNVTPAFLGKEAIRVVPQGEATDYIDTQTGAVRSPNPYIRVGISIHLLKTQFLSGLYKEQMEADSAIGDITVRPDTRAFPPYQFFNCSIQNVGEINMDGTDPGYRITLMGYYNINNALWDQ